MVWLLGGLALVLLVYLLIISPLVSLRDHWAQELDRKEQLLQRYQALHANQAKMAKAIQGLSNSLTQIENKFLSGANAALAASDLQEILKNLAESNEVRLISANVLQPQEFGAYVEVPVQVQFTGTIGQLLTILYNLEQHKKFLYVPELEINAPRRTAARENIEPLRVNMVVAGIIKKKVKT